MGFRFIEWAGRGSPSHSRSKCLSRNFCSKTLDESCHRLPSNRLSDASFGFLVWKNESSQTHVSGRTLSDCEISISWPRVAALLGSFGRWPTWLGRMIVGGAAAADALIPE